MAKGRKKSKPPRHNEDWFDFLRLWRISSFDAGVNIQKIRRFFKKVQKGAKIKPFYSEHLRWFIVFFLALVSFAIILIANRSLNKEAADLAGLRGAPSSGEAWLEFDFGNGAKRKFVGDFAAAIPLSMVLEANRKEAGLSLDFKAGRIDKIDGRSGKWVIYQNNKKVSSPFVKLTVKGGDRYLFKLEK